MALVAACGIQLPDLDLLHWERWVLAAREVLLNVCCIYITLCPAVGNMPYFISSLNIILNIFFNITLHHYMKCKPPLFNKPLKFFSIFHSVK